MTRSRAGRDDEIESLLAAARRGEESGFTGLYRLLGGKVGGYLRARGVAESDEVTNEVFLGAFRNLSMFEGDAAGFRAWVFGIAWNKSVDWHRAHARRPPLDDGSPIDERVGGDVEREVMDRLGDPSLIAALATLTEDQRNVLYLRFVADLSLEQVADALGKPIGAVKALQHRAVARLQREMSIEAVSPTDATTNTDVR